ncbi:DnaK suppressor protein [Roseibium sp. TrichSKD4]|uniref:TraR/DksA C4-type zinc finger protein n=1 Tax=Roseibium sp. TrichSKD4 TaxID=744980 RepID=UPI0001E5760E|nr:TraR/DksA C4-type zinc finger protein [Roseibium sp. TrichSKD4]EFO30949.1 DnaK suppressor protein [Roseibium sp. TrichSKD4]
MSEFDDVDRANALAEREREAGIRHVTSGMETVSARTTCVDCGDPIPLRRRELVAGAVRCAPCQQDHEQGWN